MTNKKLILCIFAFVIAVVIYFSFPTRAPFPYVLIKKMDGKDFYRIKLQVKHNMEFNIHSLSFQNGVLAHYFYVEKISGKIDVKNVIFPSIAGDDMNFVYKYKDQEYHSEQESGYIEFKGDSVDIHIKQLATPDNPQGSTFYSPDAYSGIYKVKFEK